VLHTVCSKCGFQIAGEAKFCMHCGQEIIAGQSRAPEPATTIAPNYVNDPVTLNAGRFKAKAIGQLLVVIAGLFLFTEAMTAFISDASSRLAIQSTEGNAVSAYAPKPGRQGPGMSFAENLIQAKDYLVAAGSQPNEEWARYNLGQIPETAPEFKEAQILLAVISAGTVKPPSDFEIENAEAVEALAGIDKSLTYPKLKKDPDQYRGETCAFNGKVVEIRDQGDYGEANVLVTPAASDAIHIDGYFPLELVVNEFVYVIGTVSGPYTYETRSGARITVPQVSVTAMFEQKDIAKLKAALTRLEENKRIVAMVEEKAAGAK
jgi:hypothetical protein